MRILIAVVVIVAAAVAVLFAYSSPTASPDLSDADRGAVVADINTLSDGMLEAWNRWDLDASLSYFHPEKTSFAWGSAVYDHTRLRERWNEIWSTAEGQECSWTRRGIQVLSEEAVLFQGSFELRIHYQDGRVVLYPGTAHWTVLLEPFNGEWKITYGGYSYGGAQTTEGA